MKGPAIDTKAARKARLTLPWMFLVMGLGSMAWVPRIPEIKIALGLNDAQFGLMLAASSVGAVIGAQNAGKVVHAIGSKNVLRMAQLIMPAGIITMGATMNVPGLMIGLFIMGLGYSAMDIAANSQAVVAEEMLGKKFLASLHGAWSIGTFVTALLGGLIAQLVSPAVNLVVVGLTAVALNIGMTEAMMGKEFDKHIGESGSKSKMPWFGGKYILLWAFAMGSLGSFVAEGAAMDWGGILLAEHMGVPFGLTASVFATFSLAMIISRFTADSIMEKIGPRKTITRVGLLGGSLWAAGIWSAILLHGEQPLIAMILVNAGFFFAGIAIGPMFPAFIADSAKIDGVPPSLGIARIGVISIAGYFVGPTITGFISELTSLPVALMYPALALVLSGLLGKYLRN